MKKFWTVVLISLLLCSSFVFAEGAKETTPSGTTTVGVSKFLSHPALDAVEQGMQDYLSEEGYSVTYDWQNANAEVSAAAQIAQKFKSDKVDIAVGIATPNAQSLVNVMGETPVVFSAITDPLDAGLVPSYEPGYTDKVAGVSDMNPVEAQISLLVELTGAKTIGNVYASGEANGVILMEMAKAACEKLGVEFVTAAVANTSEVMSAAQSIAKRIDAMYIATDNTVISALPSIDDVTSKAGIALMSADPSGVDGLNFLVAMGFDYYKIGRATGKIVGQIIDGTEPGEIGTVFLSDPADFELWLNVDAATELGITIPQDLLDEAAVIYENGVKK
ncbi:MAG: ABC transporter substrate-binding protein [Sphaerochaetaceae bacterium]|nr:ABC transporter substrate-binding protein [Sphaerochaetaceae bacterium]MDC7248040.1 ABC transporter substrate-binding protein [Sphaerochaetaceae bacterium]